ncbi:MAG: hypothetical protein DMF44_02175 [Verrucomicrobia bacterium]|nr:MAG: hypothetical protein DMF44_02175 [Verrucomicrobiota bacterium]
MKKSYNIKKATKVKLLRIALTNAYAASSSRTWSRNFGLPEGGILPTISGMTATLSPRVTNSTRIRPKNGYLSGKTQFWVEF